MIIGKNSNLYKELKIKEISLEKAINGNDILIVTWIDGKVDKFIPTRV